MPGKLERKTGGRCYEVHAHWIVELSDEYADDVRLIHGSVWSIPWDKRIKHCWLELGNGDVVLDLTIDFVGRAEVYYSKAQAHADKVYTKLQAMKNMVKYGHYGDWKEEEKNV